MTVERLAREAGAIRDGADRAKAVADLLAAVPTRLPPDRLACLFATAARHTTRPMIPGCALAETFLHGAFR